MRFQAAIAIFGLATFAGANNSYSIVSRAISNLETTQDAIYSCTFINKWTPQRHPANYPSDAHWTPPIVFAHNAAYQLWDDGQLASQAVEKIAEVGTSGYCCAVNWSILSPLQRVLFIVLPIIHRTETRQPCTPNLTRPALPPANESLAKDTSTMGKTVKRCPIWWW